MPYFKNKNLWFSYFQFGFNVSVWRSYFQFANSKNCHQVNRLAPKYSKGWHLEHKNYWHQSIEHENFWQK
jgi:hypothetical protein